MTGNLYKIVVVGKNKIYSMIFGRDEVKELRSQLGELLTTTSRTIAGVQEYIREGDNDSGVKSSKNDGL